MESISIPAATSVFYPQNTFKKIRFTHKAWKPLNLHNPSCAICICSHENYCLTITVVFLSTKKTSTAVVLAYVWINFYTSSRYTLAVIYHKRRTTKTDAKNGEVSGRPKSQRIIVQFTNIVPWVQCFLTLQGLGFQPMSMHPSKHIC